MSDDDDDKPSDEEVGYKQPPRRTRFKKGQSGNPKGRPKREEGEFDAFERISRRKVRFSVNGEMVWRTVDEIILWQVVSKAMKGDAKACKEYFARRDRYMQAKGEGKGQHVTFIIDGRECGPDWPPLMSQT